MWVESLQGTAEWRHAAAHRACLADGSGQILNVLTLGAESPKYLEPTEP